MGWAARAAEFGVRLVSPAGRGVGRLREKVTGGRGASVCRGHRGTAEPGSARAPRWHTEGTRSHGPDGRPSRIPVRRGMLGRGGTVKVTPAGARGGGGDPGLRKRVGRRGGGAGGGEPISSSFVFIILPFKKMKITGASYPRRASLPPASGARSGEGEAQSGPHQHPATLPGTLGTPKVQPRGN